MEMTEKQEKVYKKLRELYKEHKRPIRPTEVGIALGYKYGEASPHCTSGINKALKLGLIKRVGRGEYILLEK